MTDRKDATIHAKPAEAWATVGTATFWQTYSWARAWYEDALREARIRPGTQESRHARRREVLFAVCFAESYLFEWLRDEVLKRDYPRLQKYLTKRGVYDKWREIPKRLCAEGLIPSVPKSGDSHSQEWRTLVYYRDGLVHARASRPETSQQPREEGPVPSVADLDGMRPGWAVRVVAEQVRRLHEGSGTPPPDWLADAAR